MKTLSKLCNKKYLPISAFISIKRHPVDLNERHDEDKDTDSDRVTAKTL